MSDPVQQLSFDYESLDETTRSFVLQKAYETHGLLKRTVQNILQIGSNLQQVKEKLPHGQFLPWLQAEFSMTERHARNFMHVAARFGERPEIISDLSVTIIYELAAPSTSEEVIEQVEKRQIPPRLDAIRAAKEAERLAREAEGQAQVKMQETQQQLFVARDEIQTQQAAIEQLTQNIEALQRQIETLSVAQGQIQEIHVPIIPSELTNQIEALQKQVVSLTRQRDELSKQAMHLSEEARTAALKQLEGDAERRLRLQWYQDTNQFQQSLRSILARWPSPLDAQQYFEAKDWERLSYTKALASRFIEECNVLMQQVVVDVSSVKNDATYAGEETSP